MYVIFTVMCAKPSSWSLTCTLCSYGQYALVYTCTCVCVYLPLLSPTCTSIPLLIPPFRPSSHPSLLPSLCVLPQVFFIDHEHCVTTFIDPRLPLPDQPFTYTNPISSAPVTQKIQFGGEVREEIVHFCQCLYMFMMFQIPHSSLPSLLSLGLRLQFVPITPLSLATPPQVPLHLPPPPILLSL